MAAWIALMTHIYHTWVYAVWPAIRVPPTHPQDEETWTPVHPDVLSAPELSQHLKGFNMKVIQILTRLAEYRRSHPGKFCITFSVLFISLALLGKYISIIVLLHLSTLLLILLPGLYLRLSRHSATRGSMDKLTAAVCGTWGMISRSQQCNRGENELEEFLPEETQENENIMEKALGQNSDRPSQGDDSLTMSLTTGLTMPGHDEVENDSITSAEYMEEDLAPVIETESEHIEESDTDSVSSATGRVERLEGKMAGVEDSDSDSLEAVSLQPGRKTSDDRLSFKTQHYDEFSSSEDEDLLPLPPPAPIVNEAPPVPSESLLSSVSHVLPSVTSYLPNVSVSGLLSSILPVNQDPDIDLEDFELISEDEFEKESKE
jgi:hypothetical protein